MKTKPIKIPTDSSVATYFCPICRTAYATADEAKQCEETPSDGFGRGLNPGDFVLISEGYTWADDRAWIAKVNPKDKNGYVTHDFYFVITAITDDRDRVDRCDIGSDNRDCHRTIVHVATGGANIAKDGEAAGFRFGWVSNDHIRMKRVDQAKVPQALRDSAQRMIGKKTGRLL